MDCVCERCATVGHLGLGEAASCSDPSSQILSAKVTIDAALQRRTMYLYLASAGWLKLRSKDYELRRPVVLVQSRISS